MIIHNNQLGIIDFNRFDYEDSYREFIPMCVFSREVSIDFCKGQLKGYFKTGIPEDFWPRVKLYLAYTALYSVLWAESFSLNEVNQMIQRKKVIFADFNHFSLTEPKWFTE
jgi:aminoglycoside phosphotransferase (APT) family kinase protein